MILRHQIGRLVRGLGPTMLALRLWRAFSGKRHWRSRRYWAFSIQGGMCSVERDRTYSRLVVQ